MNAEAAAAAAAREATPRKMCVCAGCVFERTNERTPSGSPLLRPSQSVE